MKIPMKLDVGSDGVTIDAHDLAPLLEVDPADLPNLLRSGAITSVFEKGQGTDEGTFRVTFRYKKIKVRFTSLEDGTVRSRYRVKEPT